MTTALLAFALLSEPTPSRDNSFSIVPPYDWVVFDRRAGGVDEFIARVRKKNPKLADSFAKAYRDPRYLLYAADGVAAEKGRAPVSTLTVIGAPGRQPSMTKAVLSQIAAGVRESIPGARVTKQAVVKLASGPAGFLRVEFAVPGPKGRVPMVGRQYFVVRKGVGRAFAFTLPKADEKRTLPFIERTMSSLSYL